MTLEHDLTSVVVVLAALLLIVAAIAAFSRLERRRVTPARPDDPPTDLPGFWPSAVRSRYLHLDDDARRRWWRRYNWTILLLVWPLFLAGAIVGLMWNNIAAVVLIAAMIAVALLLSVSGR